MILKTAYIPTLLLAALFVPCVITAATNSLPPELACYPLPDEAKVIAGAATVTTNRYPDANTVLVDCLARVAYRSDGTSITVCDEYTKVLTEKGRNENGIRSFPFWGAYETVTVTRAEIIKPDGRRDSINPMSNSCVMIDNSQMGQNIYDKQAKILQITFPGLEVGDLLCLMVQRTAFKAVVPETWFDQTSFESVYPILHVAYEVIAPPTRPLKHLQLRSPGTNSVTYASQLLPDGRTLHRWVARDVPQVFQEPQMPDINSVVQRVLLSTAPDWQTISRWYWNLCSPRLDTVTPEMRTTVSNLVTGITERDARIWSIFTFVSQKIRYMGITTEEVAPGFEPHDVSLTFRNRYGVCRDKAALLVAMLRLADIEAYPVLIMVGPKLDPNVPIPNFNHAVVALARPGGGYDLMDPTDENAHDLCPAYLGNCSYLVARPDGEALRVSAVSPAEKNMMRISSTGVSDEAGTLTLDISLAFEGINDTAYRTTFLEQTPDERRRYFEQCIKSHIAGAELTAFSLKPADLMDTSVPLVAKLTCRARHYPVAGGGVTLLSVPWLTGSLGCVSSLCDGATLPKRMYPYVTSYACGVEETVSITLNHDMGRPLEFSPPMGFRHSGIDYQVGLSVTNGVLKRHVQYVLQKPEYSPAEYADLKQTLRDIEYASRQRITFTNAVADQDDVRILSDELRIDIKDMHTWTRTRTIAKEVLTYTGMKIMADMKRPFNPGWQTVELVSATVSNRDGSVHSVMPNEINIMDADWVGGAPRYPAGKLHTVSFPGVEIGSVIQHTYRTVQHDAPFFFLEHHFTYLNPVQHISLEIRAPLKLGLHMEALSADLLHKTCVTNGGMIIYRWIADALPKVVTEDSLPPSYLVCPTVLISAGNWATYGRTLNQAFEAAMRGQPVVRKKAQALVRGLRDDDSKLLAIRDYVAKTVREAGPDIPDLPISCLTPADTTLADGYGNMADRAILLTAMLRTVGFNAEIVLASKSPFLASGMLDPFHNTPQPLLYDAVLVRVKLGERMIYLNDSDQYGVLGATMYDRYPLLTLNGEKGRVTVDEAYRDRSRDEWTVTLETNGCATLSVTNWAFGPSCAVLRKKYEEMVAEQRSRDFQSLVNAVSQSAVAVGGLTTDTHGYPGYTAYTVRADRYAVRDGKTLSFQLPGAGAPVLALSGNERVNPFYVDNPSESEWRCRVILPVGVRDVPVMPTAFAWPLPDGLGRVSFDVSRSTLSDGRLCLDFHRITCINPVILPATIYPSLLEINRRLTHPSMSTVMVRME